MRSASRNGVCVPGKVKILTLPEQIEAERD